MEIRQLEELVCYSIQDGPYKAQATRQLDALRGDAGRWRVGIQMFTESQNDMTRYYGLSLIRDFLSNSPADGNTNQMIRQTCWGWIEVLAVSACPPYIFNNLCSILTLCIKRDFPEAWPSAFDDLLSLGGGQRGAEVVVRVLGELEVEVVVFAEHRSKEEVAHNTLIKDTMRETATMLKIVSFLCSVIDQATAAAAAGSTSSEVDQLAAKCLHCLGDLIGWIDIQLVAAHALRPIYAALGCAPCVSAAALVALGELSKKGMDPVAKVGLLKGVGLLDVLLGQGRGSAFLQAEATARPYAAVIDMLLLELLGCWARYEDLALAAYLPQPPSTPFGSEKSRKARREGASLADLSVALGTVHEMLRALVPEAIAIIRTPAAAAIWTSTAKLIQLLKAQKAQAEAIHAHVSACGPRLSAQDYFLVSAYMDNLLVALHAAAQYPEDFDHEADDDDDEAMEIVEAKCEARRYFTNVSRVYPERCLELLTQALSALPQPLSSAPVSPLEASLHLLQAIDCPLAVGLLISLAATGLPAHPNNRVCLSYHEVCLHYCSTSAEVLVPSAIALSARLLAHPRGGAALYGRTVALLLKYAGCLGAAAGEGLFRDVAPRIVEVLRLDAARSPALPAATATDLYELLGLLCCRSGTPEGVALYAQAVGYLSDQLRALLLQQPLEEQLAAVLSGYSALLRHLPRRTPEEVHPYAAAVQSTFEAVLHLLRGAGGPGTGTYARCIAYLHHYLGSASSQDCLRALPAVCDAVLASTPSGVPAEQLTLWLALLVQLLVLHPLATPLVVHYHPLLMSAICAGYAGHAGTPSVSTSTSSDEGEAEAVGLQRGLLDYYKSLATSTSTSSAAAAALHLLVADEAVLQHLLWSVKGYALGGARVSKAVGLPQRRAALLIVHTLLSPAASALLSEEGRGRLREFLLSAFLPIALMLLGEPRGGPRGSSSYSLLCADYTTVIRLMPTDAASQGVIAEAAALLYALRAPSASPSALGPAADLLLRMGWAPQLVDTLFEPLRTPEGVPGIPVMPLGGFKEFLKQFVKQHLN